MKKFIANLIAFIPALLVFIAFLLAFGSYNLDILSIAFFAGALLIYKPCQFVADRLWGKL